MNRPNDKYEEHEWIERYLSGDMAPEERVHFENEMQTDATLKNDVEKHKQAQDLIQEAFLAQRAVATLKKLQAQDRQIIRIGVYARRFATMLAAACVAFLVYLSVGTIRFPDSETDFTLIRGVETDTVQTRQKYVFEQFFEGQSHITEGQYALAVKNFRQVLQSSDLRPYFKEAAQWHLALAYLKSGEADKAERIYNQFTDCDDCEYPVSTLNRWQIWWQIKLAQLLH